MSVFNLSLGNVFYFPFWWYTRGLKSQLVFFSQRLKKIAYALALKIMLKSLFKPMFGQFSISGRIISFFMRVVILVWRFTLFFLGLAWQIFLLFLYLIILPGVIYLIFRIIF
ncbi:hypothetical protein J7J60_02290 [bacterium]|nr:hypothetical protein [bacterium]